MPKLKRKDGVKNAKGKDKIMRKNTTITSQSGS